MFHILHGDIHCTCTCTMIENLLLIVHTSHSNKVFIDEWTRTKDGAEMILS